MNNPGKIAFGGGCHWCTEAIFQSVKGVHMVEQGFISSYGPASEFSEAVIVHFDPELTRISDLIRIHLHTHSSTSDHNMRGKYRSAIYIFSEGQKVEIQMIMESLQEEFSNEIITEILPFRKFEPSEEKFQNYYLKGPDKPFCRNWIQPKLELLLKEFPNQLKNPKENPE